MTDHQPMVMATDPGPEHSAWVLYDGVRVLDSGMTANALLGKTIIDIREKHKTDHTIHVVIEMIESFGMPVGHDIFETLFWIGRFFEFAEWIFGEGYVHRLSRRAVKLHLCGNMQANDRSIRVVLWDLFGGKEQARGRKAAPGPLYALRQHQYAALALAVTWWETTRSEKVTRVTRTVINKGDASSPSSSSGS